MEMVPITRRESLATIGAMAAGAIAWNALSTSTFAAQVEAATPPSSRKRAIRLAHLTDVHVQPEKRAGEGMAACLHHVQQLTDRPDLILTGGDHVMDSFGADDARTKLQWDLWSKVLKADCSIPVRSCIGNHDVWGWDKPASKTTGSEANWGKRRATEMLGIEDRYYTFPQAGWQFVVLDSVHEPPAGQAGYTGRLDDAQFAWLAATLRDTPATTPVLILSHIPILSASALLWSTEDQSDLRISRALMHTDCLKLKELFAQHSNVKLCLSGHLHLCDRVDYNGVTYLCNGAVCGNWWGGRHKDCDEGYAVLNLYDDGSFDHEYVKYGWKAV
ncbi:MAG: metallophosphoesterase [Pirellulales bacterium]